MEIAIPVPPAISNEGLKNTIKERLNQYQAPGQCYDGFLCQLVDLWEKTKEGRLDYMINPGKGR